MKTGSKTKYPAHKPATARLSESTPTQPIVEGAMIRTQIYLSRKEHDFLQAESRRRGEPMAAVIRGFVDEKMAIPKDAWVRNPMLEPTSKDAGFHLPEDAAINHDHYLYGTPKKHVKSKGRWVSAQEARG